MRDIELLEVRPVASAGNVRAFVTIQLGGVTIHGCKIVQQQGQAAWLAMPDRSYPDASGKQRWAAHSCGRGDQLMTSCHPLQ